MNQKNNVWEGKMHATWDLPATEVVDVRCRTACMLDGDGKEVFSSPCNTCVIDLTCHSSGRSEFRFSYTADPLIQQSRQTKGPQVYVHLGR